MQRWIRQGYGRGGVVTISWHMNNPATGGNAWDTTRAVHVILPGGEKHEEYTAWLDRFAEFTRGLGKRGFLGIGRKAPAPVIFRPFHEHTGSWFWWGKGHLSPEEYIQLWRFTVTYLRDVRGVHNLLYAYSPDAFDSEEQYLEYYPGDAYVDVLGFDDYGSLRTEEGVEQMSRRMRMVVEMAEARNKLAALTETGLEGIPVPNWWTGRLLRALDADEVTRRIVYALVWRNAHQDRRPGHHYAPYAGHLSAADFAEMRMHPLILFEDDLPELYR
jgi:mannan endo-1,4-beta-mannosidase